MVLSRYLPLKIFDFYPQKVEEGNSKRPSVYADLNTGLIDLLTKKSLAIITSNYEANRLAPV